MLRFRRFTVVGPLTQAPGFHSWDGWMDLALAQARMGLAAGEVPVGALVIDPAGAILAAFSNRVERDHDPAGHAEILCLREAGRKLRNHQLGGCVLVATLEPCAMCAAACLNSRIAGIVFGALDVQAGAIISNADLLDFPDKRHHPWHMGGVRSGESAALLNSFFRERRNRLHPSA